MVLKLLGEPNSLPREKVKRKFENIEKRTEPSLSFNSGASQTIGTMWEVHMVDLKFMVRCDDDASVTESCSGRNL